MAKTLTLCNSLIISYLIYFMAVPEIFFSIKKTCSTEQAVITFCGLQLFFHPVKLTFLFNAAHKLTQFVVRIGTVGIYDRTLRTIFGGDGI